jgi:ubiquinone/menaquinone biosynthesis C-methylase UbiE
MLNIYGAKIGAKQVLRGQIKQGLKKLVRPVSYWRTVEYRLVLEEAEFQGGERVLDIGSPKLLSVYISGSFGSIVYATDVDDYFIKEYSLIRQFEKISPEKLELRVEDARNLSFSNQSIDKVYSISTFEHIPEDGDTQAVREIARVLLEGGKCFISVPFSPSSKEEFIEADKMYWAKHSVASAEGKVFYQRRYSEQDLFKRLIEPSGLKLEKVLYVGEKLMVNSQREFVDLIPVFAHPFAPLFSKLLHTKPVSTWQELKKPLLAFVVLKK